jgi:transcription antitermination factor NusG
MDKQAKWYALFVVQGKEFYIKERLDNLISLQELRNVDEVLLPTIKEISEVRRKKIVRNITVYPSYLFVHGILNGDAQQTITGVAYTIKFLGELHPYPIPEDEMQIVRAVSGENVVRSAFTFKIGDMIEILGGHCKGLAGRIIDIHDINTLKVEIQIFNRTIGTTVKLEDAKVA